MKDLSSLKKKLAGYSAVASVMLAANNHTAEAQVIYTDIIPDAILDSYPNTDYYIDMNNDGTADFRLANDPYDAGGYAIIIALPPNTYCMATTNDYAAALDECTIISALPPNNNSWVYEITEMMFSWTGGSSPWINAVDKFAAVILHLNDGNHYGWIRMTHNANQDSIFVKDFAYEATADSSILTPCPTQIRHIDPANLFNVFVKDHQLNIRFNQSFLPSQMLLLNEVGMKLREQSVTQSELVMDVNQLAAGIYFVVVVDEEKRQVKKVVIE